MKKQTKPKDLDKEKKPTRVAVAMYDAVVVHTRRQKIIGGLALAGLFLCGFMLGNNTPNVKTKVLANNNVVVAEEETMPACDVIENVLLGRLYEDGFVDSHYPNHNIDIYAKLITQGCPENKEKYEKMILREKQIVDALNENTDESERGCARIESLLKTQMRGLYDPSPNSHVDNAKIYANLSERGCPENREHYVDLAKQELQIARALQDDQFYDNEETLDVVETYKRLNMQAAAEEIFEKAKRLTNPAIDFILQVEKIINE